MIKRLTAFLLLLVLLFSMGSTFALANYDYQNETFDFSLSLPENLKDTIDVVENKDGISLIYKPAVQGDWHGLICSIVVKTPRSAYFSPEYYGADCVILAMNASSAYIYVPAIGGVDSGEETRAGFLDAAAALSPEYLKNNLKVSNPDSVPVPDAQATLSALNGFLTDDNDAYLSRAETAEILFSMLQADNKDNALPPAYADQPQNPARAQAINYLTSYGIANGYPDGTFRPDAKVTRAEFVAMLHRLLFIPYPWWYGQAIAAADVSSDHWAWNYLNCACQEQWLIADADGCLRPDAPITRGEAERAIHIVYDHLVKTAA